jgi:hypothetical protein
MLHVGYSGIMEEGEGTRGKGKAPCSWAGKKKQLRPVNAEQERKSKWEPPPAGWIKFNVQQSGEAGVGVIARDSKGDVLLTA